MGFVRRQFIKFLKMNRTATCIESKSIKRSAVLVKLVDIFSSHRRWSLRWHCRITIIWDGSLTSNIKSVLFTFFFIHRLRCSSLRRVNPLVVYQNSAGCAKRWGINYRNSQNLVYFWWQIETIFRSSCPGSICVVRESAPSKRWILLSWRFCIISNCCSHGHQFFLCFGIFLSGCFSRVDYIGAESIKSENDSIRN